MPGVKFFNVRGGETVFAETEPMIAAFFNSSDLNPNGLVQDYGWRIHPKMVKRIRDIEDDEDIMEKIAKKLEIPLENVATYHILMHIVDQDARAERKGEKESKNAFQEQYDAEVAAALAEEENTADEAAASTGAKKAAPRRQSNKPRTATPAQIEEQKKKDDDVLAKMIAEDDNKES